MKRLIGILALILLATLPRVEAEPVPEYDMKATYLYNFALYTEWPIETTGNIRLCIFGEDHFGNALRAIDGKMVNAKRLEVHRISNYEGITDCQVLFLGEQEARNPQKILDRIGDLPVLTVTEGSLIANSGLMLSMVVENNRLGFYVNANAARKSGLNVSSKLLRLAKKVY